MHAKPVKIIYICT